MKVLVRKVGNSLVITLPSDITNILKISENDCIDLEIDNYKGIILRINRRSE